MCQCLLVGRIRASEPEVEEYRFAVGLHDDVGRLDVAMDHVGGMCGRECVGDAFCDPQDQFPGICSARLPRGSTCTANDDAQCEDGLVCFTGSCEPLGAMSQPCGTGLPAGKPGLECVLDGSDTLCLPLSTLRMRLSGEDCDVTADLCEPPLVCASRSGNSGVCEETVSPGEPCRRAVPNQCPPFQFCDASDPGEVGSCLELPGAGDPCLTTVDGSGTEVPRRQACADGYICNADLFCSAIGRLGDSCGTDAECYSRICGEDLLCVPPAVCEP